MRFLLLFSIVFIFSNCKNNATKPTTNSTTEVEKPKILKHTIDESDPEYGYYLTIEPKGNIEGALLLLPGFGQLAQHVLPETKLHEVAAKNNLLTICFSTRFRSSADDFYQNKLNAALTDVIKRYDSDPEKFVIGGFSAGGVIALRYTELCKEFPDQFPINPQGVFMADSPVDMFLIHDFFEEAIKENRSEVAVAEAKGSIAYLKKHYGKTPPEDPEFYGKLSPFSINPKYGENEKHLKDVAVRTYHDVDINWRLLNRNQPMRFQNYIATSELINRLLLMGNERAEFIQTFETGYRSNGKRHPHSWSIIDEEECIDWVEKLVK